MAWVGALAVITGITLFVKYAYDEGWLGFVSLGMRCAIAGAFGLLLLSLGEVALRKVSRAASVGLFAAGIGTLYVTALVSFHLEVIGSAGMTLALLALVAGVGVAVAVRAEMLSISIVSMIAGYAAPLFVPDAGAFRAALPAYLTMTLLVGLVLSALRPRPFRPLRAVTFGAHALVGAIWIFDAGSRGGILEMAFMAGWWLMLTGEGVYAAIRRQSPLGNAIISLLATTWFALFGCVVLNSTSVLATGLAGGFCAGVGVLAAAIALQFRPGLDVLRRAPQNALEKLAASLWVQSGALLVVAAALHFSNYGTTIAWLLLGLAAVECGRRLPSVAVDRFGLGVTTLGLLRLMTYDQFFAGGLVAFNVGGVSISQWMLLIALGIGVLQAAAWRLRQTGSFPRTYTPPMLVVLSALIWLFACGFEFEGSLITVTWLGGAVMLIALGSIGSHLHYLGIGMVLLGAAAARWLAADLLGTRLYEFDDWISLKPVLNHQALLGALILSAGVGGLGVDRWMRRRPGRDGSRIVTPARYAMGALLLLLLSFEVDRAVSIHEAAQRDQPDRWADGQLLSLCLTLLWSVGGAAIALVGVGQRRSTVFFVGAWMLGACAAAWLVWDTVFYRLSWGAARVGVVFNVQFLVGAAVVAGLGVLLGFGRYRRVGDRYQSAVDPGGASATAMMALAALIGLWLGSLEIDRFFNPEVSTVANAAMARQTGLSVYWGIYGIALVVAGFWRRLAPSRYAGLALLAITLLKVVTVDMSEVQYIYRVASFIGVGLLFVLTSIAYAKMSPRLLAAERTDPVAKPESEFVA